MMFLGILGRIMKWVERKDLEDQVLHAPPAEFYTLHAKLFHQ